MPLPGSTNPFGRNPYFDPGSLYGADQDYSTTPVVSGPTGYLENEPEAAYTRHIAGYGGGLDNFSRFVQSQFDRLYNQGYTPAVATNPNLTFQDYLKPYGQDFFQNMWANASQSQRGENSAMFAGRPRWVSNG